MTPISFKERTKQQREHEIILAAGQMMRERGYADLNMDDLATEVGISKPTLYHHFKSKEELVSQVLIRSFEMFEDYLNQPSTLRPVERIAAALRLLLQKRYEPDSFLANIGSEPILSAFVTNPELVASKGRILAQIVALIDEAKTKGEIVALLPSPFIARAMFCMLGMWNEKSFSLACTTDRDSLNQIIENMIYLLMHGITTEGTTEGANLT